MNDRYDPNWKVLVDGQPASLLRANFITRAVAVSAGKHEVEFRLEPQLGPFYLSLSMIALGVVLVVILAVPRPV